MVAVSKIPLKYMLPMIIFGCAVFSIMFSYFNVRSGVVGTIERIAIAEMSTDLENLQGTIQLLLVARNINDVRNLVRSYEAEPEHEVMLLTDVEGHIVASTNIEYINLHWTESDNWLDPNTVGRVTQTSDTEVILAQEKDNILGYSSVCASLEIGPRRPNECGFLYYRSNIKKRKDSALAAIRSQLLQQGIGIGVFAILLWCILHLTLIRRMANLIAVADHFGDTEHDALLASQAQTNAVLETAVDGIITIDSSGIVKSMNPASERMFGYRRNKVIGHNINMLMPDPYRSEHDSYITNYVTTGEKKIIGIGREARGLHSDGTIFPIELAVSEVITKNERSFTGIVRDISLRKSAEDQLRMREEELRLTFDNAPIGIVTFDLDTQFLDANRAYTQMMAYTKSELLQMKFTDIVHLEDLDKCMDLVRQAKSGNLKQNRIPQRWLCKNGRILKGVLYIGLIHDEKGHPKMFVAQIENNTERLNAEYEARQLRDRLTHVGRVSTMGEMAAGIAHEINQPLTAIASYSEACQRLIIAGATDSDDLLHAMKQTSAQAQRAGEVIRRLRSMVKKREEQRENADVNELIKDVVELAKSDMPSQASEIQLELTPGLPKINADPVQIQQVILNLIRNGAESVLPFPERSQTIIVHTTQIDPDHIRIAFTDNGGSVSEDISQQIFSPFFSTKSSGMGMGLSICRSIVVSHGGQLNFENNPKFGTTFYVTLPIAVGG